MPGLWKNDPATPGGKYLVKRRDGTIPTWPHFVVGAADPAAPAALRAYADEAERLRMDPVYVDDVRKLADRFDAYRAANPIGDPDAPRHRPDDPETVAQMVGGMGS